MCANELTFCVRGKPKGKGRPRFGLGKAYTPKSTRDYENQIAWEAKAACQKVGWQCEHALGLSVSVEAFFPVPKSWKSAERQAALNGKKLHLGTPDVDNIGKAILDGMNGVVFNDDKQVVHFSIRKSYVTNLDDEGRVEVSITKKEGLNE